jgi:phage FluMu gp28-like protein
MPFFLHYQISWINDNSPLKLIEKSRQIGITLADAYDSVRKVCIRGARFDVWVSSRDEAQAMLYLEDCKKIARLLQAGAEDCGKVATDERHNTTAHVLKFRTGRRIYSLSSNPNALAGKRGHVKLDEFALHQDQRLLYQVAKPVTQWGGQLCIISTHRGSECIFNELIRDIRERGNPMGWSLHSVPLQKAIEEGLAERIKKKGSKTNEQWWTYPKAGKSRLVAGADGGNQTAADPASREAFFARLRAECIDDEQWQQEYCCVPGDDAAAFLSYEVITACEDAGLRLMSFEELAAETTTDGHG